MSQKRKISLPKEHGNILEVETVQSLLLIGANGAGKTRLGTWIEIQSPQKNLVHRISAQKSLVMPDSTSPVSIQMAENALLYGNKDWSHEHKMYKWDQKPATTMQSDFDKLLVYLFSVNLYSLFPFFIMRTVCTHLLTYCTLHTVIL